MPLLDLWIAYRIDGLDGDGSAANPWNGNTKFDQWMNGLPANARVHLGPSPRDNSTPPQPIPFQTQGYYDGAISTYGWRAKAGLKIIGAGQDVTFIKLVNAASGQNFIVGHALTSAAKVDGFEISDLTLDCNLASAGSSSSCGAVRVMGDRVRLRRVKAINWGSKDSGTPCFVFSIISGAPDLTPPVAQVADAGMEGCVVTNPGTGTVGVVTAFYVGGDDDAVIGKESHGKGLFIRDCFADFEAAGQTFTPNLTTPKYRGITMGWCRGGVVEGNQIYNSDIGGPYQDKRSIRDLIVRNNFYKNVGVGVQFGLGALVPAGGLSVYDLGVDTPGTRNAYVILDSPSHGLVVSDRMRIVPDAGTPSAFNGIFRVDSVVGDTIHFQLATPATGGGGGVVYRLLNVTRAIIEGNVIELPLNVGGIAAVSISDANGGPTSYPEAPEYVHGDIFIRNNKIRAVDGTAALGSGEVLVQVEGVKNLQVSNNVLESANTTSLQNIRCGNVTYFNNRTPSGKLIEGIKADTGGRYSELETDNDFAVIMSLFSRKAY